MIKRSKNAPDDSQKTGGRTQKTVTTRSKKTKATTTTKTKAAKRSSAIGEKTKTTRTRRLVRSVLGVGGIGAHVKEAVRLAIQNTMDERSQPARFYDDSPDNIDDVQKDPQIECIQVPRVCKAVPAGMEDGGEDGAYLRYIRKHGGWDLKDKDRDLYDVMKFFHESGINEDNTSDALTEKDMKDLRTWAARNPNARVVIFDFDRVINQVEGTVSYDTNEEVEERGFTAKGLAKYHMGTKKRMRAFRRLVNELVRRGIFVHIVTNNTAAGCELFYSIVKHIHPVFTRETVHGSYDYETKLQCIRDKKLL